MQIKLNNITNNIYKQIYINEKNEKIIKHNHIDNESLNSARSNNSKSEKNTLLLHFKEDFSETSTPRDLENEFISPKEINRYVNNKTSYSHERVNSFRSNKSNSVATAEFYDNSNKSAHLHSSSSLNSTELPDYNCIVPLSETLAKSINRNTSLKSIPLEVISKTIKSEQIPKRSESISKLRSPSFPITPKANITSPRLFYATAEDINRNNEENIKNSMLINSQDIYSRHINSTRNIDNVGDIMIPTSNSSDRHFTDDRRVKMNIPNSNVEVKREPTRSKSVSKVAPINLSKSNSAPKPLLNNAKPFNTSIKDISRKSKSNIEVEIPEPKLIVKHAHEPVVPKKIPLPSLLSFINEFFISKEKYDHQIRTSNLPFSSFSEQLDQFLIQKYGLPSIIQSNKMGIMESIESYWSDNVDVHVFRLMLHNQLNDRFRSLHEQLKVAAADLVQALLKRQYYLKPDSYIQAEVGKKMRGSLEVDLYLFRIILFKSHEWHDMIHYLFQEEKDQKTVYLIVQVFLEAQYEKRIKKRPVNSNAAMAFIDPSIDISAYTWSLSHKDSAVLSKKVADMQNLSIKYSDFMQIILSHQLSNHLVTIENYSLLFEELDSDKKGFLTKTQFFNCLRRLYPEDVNFPQNDAIYFYTKCAELIDPFGFDRIVFSQLMSFLSSPDFNTLHNRIRNEVGKNQSII